MGFLDGCIAILGGLAWLLAAALRAMGYRATDCGQRVAGNGLRATVTTERLFVQESEMFCVQTFCRSSRAMRLLLSQSNRRFTGQGKTIPRHVDTL